MSRFLLGALMVAALGAGVARADTPVAVVEDISGPNTGVEAFEFLDEGREIRLQPGNTLVIGYLRSCVRETIVGGVVRVGPGESAVQGGQVGRERVECDGGRLRLSADQAARGGVMVFRDVPPLPGLPAPQLMIFGLSPILQVGRPGRFLIERLDAPSRVPVNAPANEVRRGLFDLMDAGMVLQRGGLYRLTVDTRSVIFRVHPNSRPGAIPLMQRLVSF